MMMGSGKWRASATGVCCALATALAGASSCNESGPRVYTAQRFRADPGCLESYAPLALVEAGDIGALCPGVCLLQGDDLYVSTVCAPYPSEAILVGVEDADCATALEADACDDEGEETPDAGVDAP